MQLFYREWVTGGIIFVWFTHGHQGNPLIIDAFLFLNVMSLLMMFSTLMRFFINLKKLDQAK